MATVSLTEVEEPTDPPWSALYWMVSCPDRQRHSGLGAFHVKVCLKHLLIVVPPKFGSQPALQGVVGKSGRYGVAAAGGGAVKLMGR
jgi:hypothetical protein